jgi:hypothetical protein
MKGDISINHADIYKLYGMWVVEDGYNEFVAWPCFKAISFVNWPESDGVDPDLAEPKLAPREFAIRVATYKPWEDGIGLFCWDMRAAKGIASIDAASIGRTCIARFKGVTRVITERGITYANLIFTENIPVLNEGAVVTELAYNDDYAIDGRPFSFFNTRILEGSLSSIIGEYRTKPVMEVDTADTDGVILGAPLLTFEPYNATLRCLMTASSLDVLWSNYDALCSRMTAPETRHIWVKSTLMEYRCYYVSQRVVRFFPTPKPWIEFDITVNVYSSPYSATAPIDNDNIQ